MKKIVYVVTCIPDWEDELPVCVFENEEEAKKYAEELKNRKHILSMDDPIVLDAGGNETGITIRDIDDQYAANVYPVGLY